MAVKTETVRLDKDRPYYLTLFIGDKETIDRVTELPKLLSESPALSVELAYMQLAATGVIDVHKPLEYRTYRYEGLCRVIPARKQVERFGSLVHEELGVMTLVHNPDNKSSEIAASICSGTINYSKTFRLERTVEWSDSLKIEQELEARTCA